MTRKEFAQKYNVDYNIVVAASQRIKKNTYRQKNVQYSENDLGEAVCKELSSRINRCMLTVERLEHDYARMRVICWMCAI